MNFTPRDYTTRKTAAEIAAHFRAQIPLSFNAPEGDGYPGGPEMVVREKDGERILQGMGLPTSPQEQENG